MIAKLSFDIIVSTQTPQILQVCFAHRRNGSGTTSLLMSSANFRQELCNLPLAYVWLDSFKNRFYVIKQVFKFQQC